jgi:DNA polymerase-1
MVDIKDAKEMAIVIKTVRTPDKGIRGQGSEFGVLSKNFFSADSSTPQLFNSTSTPAYSLQGQASSVFAFCLKQNQAFSVSTSCHRPQTSDFSLKSGVLSLKSVLEVIISVIEDEGIKKMSYDIKTIHTFFKQYHIQMKGTNFDSGIASYLLNPSRASHALVDITGEYLKNIEISKRQSVKVSEGTLDIDAACSVACAEADAVFQVAGKLLPLLENHGLLRLFNEIEMPLAEVLAEMERNGIKVDRDYLANLSKELKGQIEILQSRIYTIAGMNFNINSPKQLSSVLFEKLKLKPLRKTKTGFSTDEDVLKTLAAQHELPSEVLNFRQLSKLKSTYVDAMLELINPATGRVHTSFNQTVPATGRLSSSEPNLQNIPIKTEFGKRIRQAFIADKNCLFLSADYSQIELRIVAHLSQDALLIEAFKKDADIHTRTASEVFGIMPELVTTEMRRRAKAINFGIIYGMGPYGLSAELGISQDEATGYIDNYFLHYKGVKIFIDKTISEAVEKGYVTTLFGRRRHIPEMKSESEQIRRFGDRIAINTPIQGTAADMIKVAMINIFRRLRDGNFNTRMLLQIHDELIFEVPANEIELIKGLIRKEMETAANLSVPVKVDIQIGSSWGELD